MLVENLDNLSLLKITGDDANTFLQGQLTNDINLAIDQWQYSGYCSPKGRLLALFQIWQSEQSIYALLDKSLTEATIKRLRMYVMRSKVNIEEIDCNFFGSFSVEDTTSLSSDLNKEKISKLNIHEFITTNNSHCLSFGERFLVITNKDPEAQETKTDEASQQQWTAQNIQAGLPQVNNKNCELFIPQMLNLDVLNGINFKKGCYTGQEIVARMHYLGKLKQRMFVCTMASPANNTNFEAGMKVYNDTEMKSSAGNIVILNNDSALAVLRIENINSATEQCPTFYLNENTPISVNSKQPYNLEIKK